MNKTPDDHHIRIWACLVFSGLATSFHAQAVDPADAILSIHVDGSHGNDQWSGMLKAPNDSRTDGPLQRIQTAYNRVTSPSTVIHVKEGVYREEIQLNRPYRVIIRSSSEDSEKPIISGADPVPAASWKKCTAQECPQLQHQPWLSETYFVDLDFRPNQIFQGGVPLARSRYPEAGYLFTPGTAKSTRNSINDPALAAITANLTGATCHVRTRHHLINQMTVLTHHGSTLTLAGETKFSIISNSGYYFTNVLAAMNRPGQWAFDSAQNRLYVYPKTDLENIEASRRNYGFVTAGEAATAHEITGFSIQKVNKAGIFIKNSARVYIADNFIGNAFVYGIQAVGSDDIRIMRNQIRHANSFGVRVDRNSSRAQIMDNIIYATGAENYGDDLLAGRGIAISSDSQGARISNNVIDRTGYDGIYLGADVSGVEVSHNYISNVMLSLADGGAIYTGRYYPPPSLDRIHHNIIENAYGYSGGYGRRCVGKSIEHCRGGAHGIYLDEGSSQRVVEENAVINATSGIFLHWGGDNQIKSNLFFNNRVSQILLKGRSEPGYRLQNNILLNNILVARDKNQKTLTIASDDSRFSFSQSNDNLFINPYSRQNIAVRQAGRSDNLTLREWQALTGYDKDSQDARADQKPTLNYTGARALVNPTQAPKDINLGKENYCDLQGNKKGATASLGPFAATVVVPCSP